MLPVISTLYSFPWWNKTSTYVNNGFIQLCRVWSTKTWETIVCFVFSAHVLHKIRSALFLHCLLYVKKLNRQNRKSQNNSFFNLFKKFSVITISAFTGKSFHFYTANIFGSVMWLKRGTSKVNIDVISAVALINIFQDFLGLVTFPTGPSCCLSDPSWILVTSCRQQSSPEPTMI